MKHIRVKEIRYHNSMYEVTVDVYAFGEFYKSCSLKYDHFPDREEIYTDAL